VLLRLDPVVAEVMAEDEEPAAKGGGGAKR